MDPRPPNVSLSCGGGWGVGQILTPRFPLASLCFCREIRSLPLAVPLCPRSLTLAAPLRRGGTPARYPFSRLRGKGVGDGGLHGTPSPPAPSPIKGEGEPPPIPPSPLSGTRGKGMGGCRFPFSRVVGEGVRGWGLTEGVGEGGGIG